MIGIVYALPRIGNQNQEEHSNQISVRLPEMTPSEGGAIPGRLEKISSLLMALLATLLHLIMNLLTKSSSPQEQENLGANLIENEDALYVNQERIGLSEFDAEYNALYVNREELTNDPMRLFRLLLQGDGFPRISFLGEEGMDGGGLTKEFMTLLSGALLSQLSFFKEEGDFLIPLVNEDKQKEIYQALGKVMSLGIEQNMPLRPMFSSVVYEMLVAIKNTNADEARKKLLALYVSHRFEVECDEEKAQEILKGTIPPQLQGKLGDDWEAFRDASQYEKIIDAVVEIDQGIRSHHAGSGYLLVEDNAKTMRVAVEGATSRVDISEALHFPNEEFEGFFKRWISEATEKQLEQFLFSISGLYALPTLKYLRIQSSDSVESIAFHTCGSSMDIPPALAANYEDFKLALEASLYSPKDSQYNRD